VLLGRLVVVAVWIVGHLVQLEVLLEIPQARLYLGRILIGEQRLSSVEIGSIQLASLDKLQAGVPVLLNVLLLNLCSLRLLVRPLQLGDFLIHLGLVLVLLPLQPLLDLHIKLNLLFRSVVDLSLLSLLLKARNTDAEVVHELPDFIEVLLVVLLKFGLLAEEVLLRHGRLEEEVLPGAAVCGAADTAGQGGGSRADGRHRVEALVLHNRGWLENNFLAALSANRLYLFCYYLEAALRILLIDLRQNRRLMLLVVGKRRLRARALLPFSGGIPYPHASLFDLLNRHRIGRQTRLWYGQSQLLLLCLLWSQRCLQRFVLLSNIQVGLVIIR